MRKILQIKSTNH